MPDKKKKYLELLVLISILITGLLFVFLNSRSHNNSSSLVKQEEIINNNFPEENNHQEEIIDEEIKSNPSFLDNVIINTIIFLLIFFIALYFVYFSYLSPVVINNKSLNMIFDQVQMNIQKSLLRKTVFFDGQRFFKKIDTFYEINDDKNGKKQLKTEEIGIEGEEKYSFNFRLQFYNGKIEKYEIEEKLYPKLEKIEEIKKEIKKNSDIEQEKETFFINNIKKEQIVSRCLKMPNDNEEIMRIRNAYENNYNYQKVFDSFKGKIIFFNRFNIIASLLSLCFFLLSFSVLYLIVHFFYAFIYSLIFIEENKFLFLFQKIYDVILFSNFHNFSKIIPIFGFLFVLLFNGFLFFRNNNFFTPFVYDISDKNEELTEKLMNLYEYVKFKDFLETGEIDLQIDKAYGIPYFSSSKEIKNQYNNLIK